MTTGNRRHWRACQWPAYLQTRRPTRGKLSLSTGETQLTSNRRGCQSVVNKARTDSDIAMKAIQLNVPVRSLRLRLEQLTNLRVRTVTMCESGAAASDQPLILILILISAGSSVEPECQDRAHLPGRRPHTAGGHGRNLNRASVHNRHVGWPALAALGVEAALGSLAKA